MIAGTQKKKHNTTLMIKSLPAPFFKNTATGGINNDKIIKTSLLSIFISNVLLLIIFIENLLPCQNNTTFTHWHLALLIAIS